MNFDYSFEFKNELKRLAKKWRSLPEDIETAKTYIEGLYNSDDKEKLKEVRTAFFNGKRATIIQQTSSLEVVKMRLDVRALSANDKVRIVFIAIINAQSVTFIEIFAKNQKNREDTKRIKNYLKIM
jgi:hypothetical protein